MKKGIWAIIVGLGMICMVGCAGSDTDAMYTWQDYSYLQYQTQKSPGDKSLQAYQQVMEEIIKQSEARGQRVPPGIYASLGWIYARQNEPTIAIDNFTKEKQTYPEATVFMEQLIKQSTLREEALEETPAEKPASSTSSPAPSTTNLKKEAK